MNIQIKILNKEFYRRDKLGGSYYDIPLYQTPGSAAMDLVCTEDVTLMPGERKMLRTGLALWIGSNNVSVAGLVLPRSGLGTKGLILANTVGLIDEDYQGELMISALNSNVDEPQIASMLVRGSPKVKHMAEGLRKRIEIKAGDRIAQLMIIPIVKATFQVVEEFGNLTNRANGGFGSTDQGNV